VTGGYFADPGCKDVPGLSTLGFPIAEVPERGPAIVTKVPGSGGVVSAATCKEQLLYEIHDPASYVTPDTVADFSAVHIVEVGNDRVSVDGATGRSRPESLKVSIGYRDGHIGEGQISYAGEGALERARLAAAIVEERLHARGVAEKDMRADLIGVNAIHGPGLSRTSGPPYEVRVRVAARARTIDEARRIGDEVESLYTNGPAGGGGVVKSVRDVLAVGSTFVPRSLVRCSVSCEAVP
jgi:hypothetical protein